VLRFWESRFTQIRPLKRGGGRRYYRPDDIDLLRGVRHLLYGEGYTIRGVQRILREEGLSFVQNVWRAGAIQPADDPEEEDVVESADALKDEAGGAADDEVDGEDEAEGEDEESEAEEAPTRSREPSGLTGAAPVAARTAERREPNLIPAVAVPPARPATVSQPRPAAVDDQSRQKLQAALNDLIACRNLIHAALAETLAPDGPADKAG
jgi:DNA-binding transcriptional MerR regulator